MKNVAIIIESLNLGGAEKSLVTVLNYIDYSKYKVDLILFNTGGVFESFLPKEVAIIKKDYPRLNYLDRFVFKIKTLFNLKSLHSAQIFFEIIRPKLIKHPPVYDIAIAYNQGFSTYYTALFISSKIKFTWLNTDYKSAGYKIGQDYFYYSHYNSVIAVSEFTKEVFIKELETNKLKLPIQVIKDITDINVLESQSEKKLEVDFSKHSISIVTVGRLSKHKGLHLAVETCKKLVDKGYDVCWYVVGEGSERKNLVKLIKEYGLEDKFILLGMTNNPYPYIKNCTIYVQTSLFEGLGLSLIEAAYLKKPIVTTNFPTSYSILQDGYTGLISKMNSESITEKIEIYLKDKDFMKLIVDNLSKKEHSDTLISIEKINLLLNM